MKLKISHLANGANALLRADDDTLIVLYPANSGIFNLLNTDYFCITNQDSPPANARKLGPSNVEATVIDGVETPFGGTKDELIEILTTSFFSSVGGGGTTNASGEHFEITEGVFDIRVDDWLIPLIQAVAGGATPLAKSVLSFGTSTNSQNVVNWTSVPNATSYELKRSANADMGSAVSLYTGALLTDTDDGLAEATTYYYTITASADGYISSTSNIYSKTTASGSGGDYIIPAKMFGTAGLTYDNTTGVLTASGNVIAAKSSDTSPISTEAVVEFIFAYDASWVGQSFLLGLQLQNTPQPYTSIYTWIFVQNLEMKIGKAPNASPQNATYNFTSTSIAKIQLIDGSGLTKEVRFFTSDDNGVTWTQRQSAGGDVSTDIPNGTPMMANIDFISGSITINGIKIKR